MSNIITIYLIDKAISAIRKIFYCSFVQDIVNLLSDFHIKFYVLCIYISFMTLLFYVFCSSDVSIYLHLLQLPSHRILLTSAVCVDFTRQRIDSLNFNMIVHLFITEIVHYKSLIQCIFCQYYFRCMHSIL